MTLPLTKVADALHIVMRNTPMPLLPLLFPSGLVPVISVPMKLPSITLPNPLDGDWLTRKIWIPCRCYPR